MTIVFVYHGNDGGSLLFLNKVDLVKIQYPFFSHVNVCWFEPYGTKF